MCQTLSSISLKQTQTSSCNPRTMRHLSESVRLSSDGGKNSSAVTCPAQASPRIQRLIYNGCSAGKLKQQTSCKLQRRSSACRDFYSAGTSGPSKNRRKVHYGVCLKRCEAKPQSRAEFLLSQITQFNRKTEASPETCDELLHQHPER